MHAVRSRPPEIKPLGYAPARPTWAQEESRHGPWFRANESRDSKNDLTDGLPIDPSDPALHGGLWSGEMCY